MLGWNRLCINRQKFNLLNPESGKPLQFVGSWLAEEARS
jgi:hypothetical protein